jgi:uncharacterized GH25 family protein
MRVTALIALPALLFGTMPVQAHDYWLEPNAFFVKPRDQVRVHLYVGDGFVSEAERPFQQKATVAFRMFAGGAKMDLADGQEDGVKPVAHVRLTDAETYLVAMECGPQTIKLPAAKFNAYLTEEGLDAVLAERRKAGEDKSPGRERYTRYLKCLLQAGNDSDDTWKKTLGHGLEIVPVSNPLTLKRDDRMTVKVLFDGKPLAGAKFFAHHRLKGKITTLTATTSDKGEAVFRVENSGTYLLRLVHMQRCKDSGDADWESFWAAFTFGVK